MRAELAIALVISSAAWADSARTPPPNPVAPRDVLAHELDDEAAAADRAIDQVAGKLASAEAARALRVRAAYRQVQRASGDPASAARVRAAARLLLDRDRSERDELASELARLRTARARIAGDIAQLAAIALPRQLARPAPGEIAHHFGTLEHEHSRATLSRRGIDLEVEHRCPVVAPAAGTVRYAGPIRGLDQGVIIDHASYVTVIAKLGDLGLPVGAPIAAGDRIGRAALHRVYLEVRVKLGPGGHPIDPEPLLGRPR